MSGELEDAAKTHIEALRIAREAHAVPLILEALVSIAHQHHLTGKLQTARTLAGLVSRHSASDTETADRARKIISDTDDLQDNKPPDPHLTFSSEDKELALALQTLLDERVQGSS